MSTLLSGLHAFWGFNNSRVDSVGGLELISADGLDHFTPGKVDQGWHTNEDNSRLLVANPSTIAPVGSSFSFSMWDWLPSGTAPHRLMALKNASKGRLRLIRGEYPYNALEYVLQINTGGFFDIWAVIIVTGINVTLGWNHLVFCYDRSVGSPYAVKAFVNGAKYTGSTSVAMQSMSTPILNIGGDGVISSYATDAFGWWDRVLTDDEVASLYNGGNGLEYPFSTWQPAWAGQQMRLLGTQH